ncbi:HXXEE domain-containing protein [Siminovitchia terrae]|uniref:HXXEE domain-containing protein n=1 Tax=Siminovitchia terrae TaxID=1914933 RepID=UPI001BB35252
MDEIKLLVVLFPSIFMIHEFEEIIWLVNWAKKNISSFPENQNLRKVVCNLNTSGFAFIVFCEFLIVVLLCLIVVYYLAFNLLVAMMLTYILHSIIHVIQSIVVKKYIPALGTAILTSIYAAFIIYKTLNICNLEYSLIGILTMTITIAVYFNLLLMHYFSSKFFKG